MSREIKIAILGDIFPTKDYRELFDRDDRVSLLGEAVEILQKADLAIANLEAPATEFLKPIKKTGPNLKALPKDLKLLKKSGIDVLSMVNNHILDYRPRGVLDTLSVCEKLGICTVGVGMDSAAAKETELYR